MRSDNPKEHRSGVRWPVLCCILVSFVANDAAAILPESGIYWDPIRSGSGYVIDYQNGVVSFAVYSYETDGEPVYYVGAGQLRDDGVSPGAIDPPLNTEGYYPLHWASIELYRSSGGSCATCWPNVPAQSEHVGSVSVFFPDLQHIWISDLLIERNGVVEYESLYTVERLDFARPRYANNQGTLIFHDLAGTWLFADALGQSEPFRVDLSPASFLEGGPGVTSATFEYRDEARDARVICKIGYLDQLQAWPASGCELHIGGNVVLNTKMEDVGLNRIQASPGPLPNAVTPFFPEGPYRRPGEIIGLRLETAPPAE